LIPRMKVFVAIAFAMVANEAIAHHNMTALFDFNDRVSFTGTLTKIDWRNPHTYMTVEVKATDGTVDTWLIEGPAPSFFRIREEREGGTQPVAGQVQIGTDPHADFSQRKSSVCVSPELLS
jgi:hypothetical protein